ncbi:MAG TPA: hypothetical protein VFC84_11015 [Desulfosporosinus sp.]|nr:hypothetical protein [Desulfosporosinus sp.]
MSFMGVVKESPKIFLAFLMGTVILIQLGFSLESQALSTFVIVLNSTLAVLTLRSFYQIFYLTPVNVKVLLSLSILSLFLLRQPLLLAGVLFVVFFASILLFTSKIGKVLKVGAMIINTIVVAVGAIIIIFSLLFSSAFSSFGNREEMSKTPSPNGHYNLVVTNIDEGALGGNTAVYVERSFIGLAKWRRLVLIGHWQQIPTLSWSGNYNVVIDGDVQNVYIGKKIDQR